MVFTLVLSPDYGYVAAALLALGLQPMYCGFKVAFYRKSINFPYPNAYATRDEAEKDPKLKKFNAFQRAHANVSEWMPTMMITSTLGALEHPLISAALTSVYVASRFIYVTNYLNYGAERRSDRGGHVFPYAALGNLVLATKAIYNIFMA